MSIKAYLNDSLSEPKRWVVEIYDKTDNLEYEEFVQETDAEKRVNQINKLSPQSWKDVPER